MSVNPGWWPMGVRAVREKSLNLCHDLNGNSVHFEDTLANDRAIDQSDQKAYRLDEDSDHLIALCSHLAMMKILSYDKRVVPVEANWT